MWSSGRTGECTRISILLFPSTLVSIHYKRYYKCFCMRLIVELFYLHISVSVLRLCFLFYSASDCEETCWAYQPNWVFHQGQWLPVYQSDSFQQVLNRCKCNNKYCMGRVRQLFYDIYSIICDIFSAKYENAYDFTKTFCNFYNSALWSYHLLNMCIISLLIHFLEVVYLCSVSNHYFFHSERLQMVVEGNMRWWEGSKENYSL